MKNSLSGVIRFCSFFFLLISLSQMSFAQNKTFGIGVTAPNANAALHVESPGANQGFMMPRLTTTQRTASTFKSALTTSDNGLLVFDSDLREFFVWNDTSWVALTLAAGSEPINLKGTASFSLLTSTVSSGAANAVSGITKSTDPGSWAGYFDALTGTAVYGTTRSNLGGALAPVGVYGESRGTGSVGGAFWIQNASNNYPALYSNTIGVGPSISANITNASNNAPAIVANTNGTGNVMNLINTNASNGAPALNINQAGTGLAMTTNAGINISASTTATISANQTGAASAGNFTITNASSSAATVLANSNSTVGGSSIYAVASGSQNHAGVFSSTNTSNTSPALAVMTTSTAGAPALLVNQSGTGLSIDMNGGNLKYSYATVNSGSTITTRTGVVEITGGTSYTFGWGAVNGEICIVMINTGGPSVTVEGQLLGNLQLAQFIYAAGAWRKL
jgi:hypothetical protein